MNGRQVDVGAEEREIGKLGGITVGIKGVCWSGGSKIGARGETESYREREREGGGVV